MEQNQYVVVGEAPESDSEDEVLERVGVSHTKQPSSPSNPQGIVVAGEAPESDEGEEEPDSVGSVSSAASVSSVASLTAGVKKSKMADKTRRQDAMKYNTLLHKKLRERNVSLHKNVNEFAQHAVASAARDLNGANQNLLRSQVQLQEAATALHTLHAHLSQLHARLSGVTSVAFLPHINSHSL